MIGTIQQVRKYIRKGLAATLFTMLLLGASAAALSAFAAGLNALSGVSRPPVVVAATNAGTRQPAPPTRSTMPDISTGLQQGTDGQAGTGSTHQAYIDQLNDKVDHMNSPIGRELDTGGVVLGEKVQQTFGRMLSGLLQTLLLDQPAGTAQESQP